MVFDFRQVFFYIWSTKSVGFSCAWFIPSFPNMMYKVACDTNSTSFKIEKMHLQEGKREYLTLDLCICKNELQFAIFRIRSQNLRLRGDYHTDTFGGDSNLTVDCVWVQSTLLQVKSGVSMKKKKNQIESRKLLTGNNPKHTIFNFY
jgi:hypothetical protein